MPDHHIPVYDYKGRLRGRVHAHATSVTVARFIGRHGAELKKKDGRDAWVGPKPPPKPKPKFPAAGMPGAPGTPGAAPAPGGSPAGGQKTTFEISLKGAKGSVSKPGEKK
jgi:hypothetical protein